jgi:F-type H+-transporting ATPase subunit b
MPQLDTTYYLSQIFWLVVTFALLYLLMAKVALPRVAEVLEARQARIAADLDRASAMRREAEEALAAYERRLEESRARAHQLYMETADAIARESAARQQQLEAELGERLREAETRIAAARDAALAELHQVAADVAQAATEKLIGVKVNKQQVSSAVDEAARQAA